MEDPSVRVSVDIDDCGGGSERHVLEAFPSDSSLSGPSMMKVTVTTTSCRYRRPSLLARGAALLGWGVTNEEESRVEGEVEESAVADFCRRIRSALTGAPGDGGDYGWWISALEMSIQPARMTGEAWATYRETSVAGLPDTLAVTFREASTGPAGEIFAKFVEQIQSSTSSRRES